MKPDELFSILDSVGSTNNYAMAFLHEGMANSGQAWFSANQTEGKGQREKDWYTRPGENMALSIAVNPGAAFQNKAFLFSALIATSLVSYLNDICKPEFFTVKWPNDVYWRDRKAGGILIENIITGADWKWAVAGIGLNVNQSSFPPTLPNPVSLSQITGKPFDVEQLARNIHSHVVALFGEMNEKNVSPLLEKYNELLYKKGEMVKLRKGNMIFSTSIQGVNEYGQLITRDSMERKFDFGEVEWIIDPSN